jgi:hypothetical protein
MSRRQECTSILYSVFQIVDFSEKIVGFCIFVSEKRPCRRQIGHFFEMTKILNGRSEIEKSSS